MVVQHISGFVYPDMPTLSRALIRISKAANYLSINSVMTNGPTLHPLVWLPYAPESVEKKNGFRSVWMPYLRHSVGPLVNSNFH